MLQTWLPLCKGSVANKHFPPAVQYLLLLLNSHFMSFYAPKKQGEKAVPVGWGLCRVVTPCKGGQPLVIVGCCFRYNTCPHALLETRTGEIRPVPALGCPEEQWDAGTPAFRR